MYKKISIKIKKNFETFTLIFIVLFAVITTSYFNYKKNTNNQNYNDFIDNIYFKKILTHIIENLEPKYKKLIIKLKQVKLLIKY